MVMQNLAQRMGESLVASKKTELRGLMVGGNLCTDVIHELDCDMHEIDVVSDRSVGQVQG